MDAGVKRERDMMINTQPELVSPMHLDLCDDGNEDEKHLMPLSPPPPLPRSQRIRDRTMSRRSSIRASLSFNRKSTIGPRPSAIRISAPSDFRRVQSMTNFPASKPQPQFQTKVPEKGKGNHFLELSIYNNPHHALPDLPSFDNFHITGAESPIKLPQRVFSSPPGFSLPPVLPRARARDTGGLISGSASFRLPRKPVGTAPAPRRSSTATATATAGVWPIARPEQRHSTPTSPLIPHFARIQRASLARPMPRSLSMGMGSALDRDFGFTLQDGTTHATDNEDANSNMTPPISPSPTLTSPRSQSQFQHKPLPLPLPPSQSQPGTEHTRSWSGSTLTSTYTTCTYSPKGFDVSVISRPGSRTGLGQVAVVYPYPAPTIYEGEQVVGYI